MTDGTECKARAHNDHQPKTLFEQNSECFVVSEEGGGPEQIPAVCGAFQIKCISLVELLQDEGWVFT